jgi:hypothetical protein
MKTILLTASLLLAINAVACGDHDKTEDEEKDERITLVR